MMLRIGNSTDYTDFKSTDYTDKPNQRNHKIISVISEKGFTLVEVLLSVAIVATGLVFILQAMGKEVSIVSVADDKMQTALFLRQKINEVEKDLLTKKEITPCLENGEVTKNGRLYKWTLEINESKILEDMYLIKVACLWEKFGRERSNVLETLFYKAKDE